MYNVFQLSVSLCFSSLFHFTLREWRIDGNQNKTLELFNHVWVMLNALYHKYKHKHNHSTPTQPPTHWHRYKCIKEKAVGRANLWNFKMFVKEMKKTEKKHKKLHINYVFLAQFHRGGKTVSKGRGERAQREGYFLLWTFGSWQLLKNNNLYSSSCILGRAKCSARVYPSVGSDAERMQVGLTIL